MSGQKENYARVSFFLKDIKTDKVYAVIPRHVANFINDSAYLKTRDRKVVFGRRLNSENVHTQEDLAIIEVEPGVLKNISNTVIIDSGPPRQIAIYNGTKNDIYGKPVFKSVYSTSADENISAAKHIAYIASREEHFEEGYQEGEYFFLIRNEGTPFSRPGDSGAPVCFQCEEHSSDVVVVGIISGGNDDSTICLYLPKAFEGLCNRNPKKYFSLLVSTVLFPFLIPCGTQLVIYNTPERVAPESFDLAQRVKIDTSFDLCRVNNDQTVTMSPCKLKELRMRVNQRLNHEDLAIFENDDPISLALYCRIYACDCLYDGKLDEAELRLKEAMRCAEKHAYLRIHFFPKLLTIITWLFLEQDKLDTMIETLDVSLEFAMDHKDLSGFPVEVQPYLFYDYSRCHRTLYEKTANAVNCDSAEKNKCTAIQNGRVASNLISPIYLHNKSDEHLDRYTLIACEFAVTLLGCGEEFDLTDRKIHKDHLQEAEAVLSELHFHVADVPLVQQLVYNQAMCDLNFRKQNIREAYRFAKIYKQLAKKSNNIDKRLARMRVDYMEQKINS